ncbi:MAG: thymidine phosphorylase [Acidimicrobiia bacterium]|nr:thymidine phosphorylase [Acidimicrobiia bacterium]
MKHHSIIELIERKRDGGVLLSDELQWIIAEYTADRLPDYQMSSLLMAIFINGFTGEELGPWTEAMLRSGDVLDLAHIAAPKIDKHSTGGVGDKISVPLAPMVAACGISVPMMSGRGLGHTGGTLDKLESIPGFRTRLDGDEFVAIVEKHGLVLGGQSETMAPADRRIYALRDSTGTVPSLPLIASSIMSKKLAEGINGLVLDVKTGSGAFMKDEPSARLLAETMVGIGASHGTKVVATLTGMDQPLGVAVGNANEIDESLDVLAGGGPADVVELTYSLGADMLTLGGIEDTREAALARLRKAVESGAAMERFQEVIAAQDGNPDVAGNRSLLPTAPLRYELTAPDTGFVTKCDARDIGVAGVRLGAGRERKEDDVDHGVSISVLAKVGAAVDKGDVLAVVDYRDQDRMDAARPLLERAWEVGGAADEPELIIGHIA